MSEYFGQHRENDWKLWNLPQFLSIPPEDVGVWGIPFAKRCEHILRLTLWQSSKTAPLNAASDLMSLMSGVGNILLKNQSISAQINNKIKNILNSASLFT